MQDIDFDEIDRAVSSVTTPTPKVADAAGEQVVVNTPAPVAPTPSPAPAVPAARRSSGRFMDVVHPSSDMRTVASARSTPRPEISEPPVRSNEYPDPLDFHGFSGDELSEPKEPVAQTPSEPAAVPDAEATSLESPFLSNTKVEKRPLGAFSFDEPVAEAPVTPPVATAEPEDTLLLEAPEAEELLEATNELPAEPEAQKYVAPAPQPTEEPVGPTSITQQYKEHPSTTEQPSSAIYDTEATHRPLTQSPKRKSGALVIVWILLLILVGAGIGAAVYFFVLPRL